MRVQRAALDSVKLPSLERVNDSVSETCPTMDQARKAGLRLPKINAEDAGTTARDQFPRNGCLVREEYILLFHCGHDIRVSLDFPMMKLFTVDGLAHLDAVRRKTLEAYYCVSLLHVHLKLVGPGRSVHESSLFSRRLHPCVLQHIHPGVDHAQIRSSRGTQACAQSAPETSPQIMLSTTAPICKD